MGVRRLRWSLEGKGVDGRGVLSRNDTVGDNGATPFFLGSSWKWKLMCRDPSCRLKLRCRDPHNVFHRYPPRIWKSTVVIGIESEVWVLSRARLAMHLHVIRVEIVLIIIFVPNIQRWVHEVLTFSLDKRRSVDSNYDLRLAA